MSVRATVWLRNTLGNALRHTAIGRALHLGAHTAPAGPVRVVSATRLTQRHFWDTSALGLSLKPWLAPGSVSADIRFENTSGLSAVYNAAIDAADAGEILVFVHDDVWLDDAQWLEKLRLALGRHDVVGVAGNRRRVARQPAWLFREIVDRRFVFDEGRVSGIVCHGRDPHGTPLEFGPSPARVELLDGLFLAAAAGTLQRAGVRFDERFRFDFYDMDFCRSARRAGLSMSTWPIDLTHQSRGTFGSPRWLEAYGIYLAKWKR